MTDYYIQQDNKIILFDTDKQKLLNTIEFMPQYKGLEILETEAEIVERDGGFVFLEDVKDELLQEAKDAKLKEASDKAFEYRDKTGVISFDGRPVVPVIPLDEDAESDGHAAEESEPSQTTLTVHTELLNQDDMFQRVIGFQQGIFTDDQIYNTKEDIPVYLNAQEAQALYFAITARATKLWVEDYMLYKSMIEACTTVDEVNAIVIDYDNVPVFQDTKSDGETDGDDLSPVEGTEEVTENDI